MKHERIALRDRTVDIIETTRATLSRSAARRITASDDVVMTLSGAFKVDAAGDATLIGGGAAILSAGGALEMENSGAVIIAAREAQINGGTVGIVLARQVAIGGDARVLVTLVEALAFGAALGVLLPLVRYLLKRYAPAPPAEKPAARRPAYVRFGLWLVRKLLPIGMLVLAGWLFYRRMRAHVLQIVPFLNHAR